MGIVTEFLEAHMTLAEITNTLKTMFNSSKVISSFEKMAGFYDESDEIPRK